MKTLFLSFFAGILGLSANAQVNNADEQAIIKPIDAFINSWNNHNFSDLKTYTTEDVDWVNVVGMFWQNRKEVEFAHQYFHDHMFKNVLMKKNWVKTRLIAPNVAIVHFDAHVSAYLTPSGIQVPESDNIALLICVKKGNQWFITSGENVGVDARAKRSDPVLQMH